MLLHSPFMILLEALSQCKIIINSTARGIINLDTLIPTGSLHSAAINIMKEHTKQCMYTL